MGAPKGSRNGKPFVKGDPRCGRPKLPEDLRGVKKLNKTTFIIAANKFLNMTRDEITAVLLDPSTNMIDLMLGSIIAKAAKDGDTVRANFILDRLIPRPKHTDDPDATLNVTPTTVENNAEAVPLYVVKINRQGKFLESRPSEVSRPTVIDAEVVAPVEPTNDP